MAIVGPWRRRRKGNPVRLIVGLILVLAVGLGIIYGLHWVLNPWVSAPGRPGLTGYWQGEVSMADGDERILVLHLVGDPPDQKCYNCPDIDGAAKVCGAGQRTVYEVWGDPENFRGTRFSVKTRPERHEPGLFLNYLKGEWDGDLLRLDATITKIDPDGVARSSIGDDHPPAPPVRVELRRATKADYRAAC
ncbi:hypothetical protein AB0H57_20865 [Micromonospora sp. NPDC050686]|uniref:hypothetical protein n=1 Tax=Micromonospora sp. NPDC050686 TaxID=3154631 RepID=UPI0033D6F750